MAIYDVRAQALVGSIPPDEITERLTYAIERHHSDRTRVIETRLAAAMCQRVALSLTSLTMIQGAHRSSILGLASSILGADQVRTLSTQNRLMERLSLCHPLHDQLLEAATKQSERIIGQKKLVEHKIDLMTDLVRVLMPVDRLSARSLFEKLISIADEEDYEVRHEITLLAPLTTETVNMLSPERHRFLACRVATIVGDALVRFKNEEGFPHWEALQALTTLDVGVALAAVARWDDAGIAERSLLHIVLLDDELGDVLLHHVEEWGSTPAISHWVQNRLLELLITHLPTFTSRLSEGSTAFRKLIEKTRVTGDSLCKRILDGIALHHDALDAPTLYALLGFLATHARAEDVATILERHIAHLFNRIPEEHREQWNLADIPDDRAGGLARFLFAQMSDIDLRTRWRAGHALRRLARLGDTQTLIALAKLYPRKEETSFRDPQAPFYWLAARLWLMMTLDRIADETPLALEGLGRWLLGAATDKSFPHVLVRSLSRSALQKLVRCNVVGLDKVEREELESVNISPMRGEVRSSDGLLPRCSEQQARSRERRFHFDVMDTIPYWYDDALRYFADLDGATFLESAERWILDDWGAPNDIWHWEREPRKELRSDQPAGCISHRHGELPTLERYSTYLEWHAMCCTVGELLCTHALVVKDTTGRPYLTDWIDKYSPTEAPCWLADFCGPKPLEKGLWLEPDNLEQWVDHVDGQDFLTQLTLRSITGSIVVASHHETESRKFSSSVSVRTALVSPETGAALVRALQTIRDSRDYGLPDCDNGLEIDQPGFRLLGWIESDYRDPRIDRDDPFGFGIRGVHSRPGPEALALLGLSFSNEPPARWVRTNDGSTVFSYETWGDTFGGEREESDSDTPRSNGWRLSISRSGLREVLRRRGLDLIVEIEITRRTKRHDYSRRYEEDRQGHRFDKVLLLTGDGAVEATEGHIGTWALSGEGTGD